MHRKDKHAQNSEQKDVLNQIKQRGLIFGTITKQLRGQITEIKLQTECY